MTTEMGGNRPTLGFLENPINRVKETAPQTGRKATYFWLIETVISSFL
jgi:hypothetical protein